MFPWVGMWNRLTGLANQELVMRRDIGPGGNDFLRVRDRAILFLLPLFFLACTTTTSANDRVEEELIYALHNYCVSVPQLTVAVHEGEVDSPSCLAVSELSLPVCHYYYHEDNPWWSQHTGDLWRE